MKLAVIKVVNGTFSIVSEWSDEQKAVVAFHDACKNHWNAQDVANATIAIMDEYMNCYSSATTMYKEFITHPAEPQPTEGE